MRRGAIALLLVFAAAPLAAEHDKADVVTTDDGSTLVGAIKSVALATVTLDTDPAGLLSIEWRHVVGLQSQFQYRVELNSGERRFGSLGPATGPRRLSIVGPLATTEVDFTDVFEIVPVDGHFWHRLDGSVTFGLSYTQSNEFLQYNLGGDVTYRSRRTIGGVSWQSLLSTQEDVPTTSQHNLKLYLSQAIGSKWGAFELGQVQANASQGYDARLVLGGGATVLLVQSSRTVLSFNAGAVYNGEAVTDSPEVDHSAEVVLGFGYRRFKLDSHSPRIQVSLLTFTNASGDSRFRLALNSSISWNVIGNFTLSLQVTDSYDSDPPGTDSKKNELTVVTSLGYTF